MNNVFIENYVDVFVFIHFDLLFNCIIEEICMGTYKVTIN